MPDRFREWPAPRPPRPRMGLTPAEHVGAVVCLILTLILVGLA